MNITHPSLGIVAYGAYLPQLCIQAQEIEAAQGKSGSGIPQSLGVLQKSVPGVDEDTVTLSTQAAFQALQRWDGNCKDIGALFIGSESHPYAVKPSASIVKEALGLSDLMAGADMQFACKAGTQSLQVCCGYVSAGMIKNALAIGADTAQSRPSDVLEFTAGAGGAAFIVGTENILARIISTSSIMTDTPDFWRRPAQEYPEHAGRFSGEPGYFAHIRQATQQILVENHLDVTDIDWCVFHTPNAKFPQAVAHQLGFSPKQLQQSLVVKQVGNTYAAASLLALVNVLDHAEANQKILVVSYGSGSGSDAFIVETTSLLVEKRKKWQGFLETYINALEPISYQTYRLNTGKKKSSA